MAVDRGADVLRHGHVGIQLQALERANESGRGSSVRRPARDLQLIQAHGAAAEAGEAGHRVHERGLARSVGADQADDLSRANRKTHRVGRQRGAEHGAGLRTARLAAAGAGADWTALEAWRELVAGPAADAPLVLGGPAVPNGLAIKIYPACYALQRPISAVHGLSLIDPDDVTRIVLRTPEATVAPLIHHRPATGLEAKFSLEYAVAAALLDAHPGFGSFTDAAARRPEAQRLVRLVETRREPGGSWLLDGEIDVELHSRRRRRPHAAAVSARFPAAATDRRRAGRQDRRLPARRGAAQPGPGRLELEPRAAAPANTSCGLVRLAATRRRDVRPLPLRPRRGAQNA